MRYLVDTNVVLRFINQTDPQHALMRSAIHTLLAADHEVCLVAQNCIEFWNVTTRPVARNGYGLSITAADASLRALERLFLLLPEQPTIYSAWRDLVTQFGVAGVQVHDARLVAAMRVHTVTHILTANVDDFARYAPIGIVAVHPAQV